MKQTALYGAIALGVIIAGALYLNSADHSVEAPTSTQKAEGASGALPGAPSSVTTVAQRNAIGQPQNTDSTPSPADPRLAALAVSPPNDLIEFVMGEDGKVIAEIDKDPASISFQKPLREYTYSGNRVIGLIAYRYLPDQVEISRTRVSYKPDGSIDEFAHATAYGDANNKP
jgi:hypothetical protein